MEKAAARYRIIIADDEKFIIQLIEKLIDFDLLNVEVVGKATDGLTALEMVNTLQPDILITDIKMPYLNGLQLIEEVRKIEKPISIIAVSGYRRFDYAYGAIKGGVNDYLLKPISKQELNQALRKACARCSGAVENAPGDASPPGRPARDSRCGFLRACADGDVGDPSPEAVNERFGYHLQPGRFVGIAIRIDLMLMREVFDRLNQICVETVRESLVKSCADMEFMWIDDPLCGMLYCGILNVAPNLEGQLDHRIKHLFERLRACLDLYESAVLTIGVGNDVARLAELPASLRRAMIVTRIKTVLGGNRIYSGGPLELERTRRQIPTARLEELRAIVEERRFDSIPDWLRDAFDEIPRDRVDSPLEALSMVDSALASYQALCDRFSIRIPDELQEDYRVRASLASNMDDMLACLSDFMRGVLNCERQSSRMRNSYQVKHVKQFIAEHLTEDLRLEDIAEHVMLSPNYLSSLFKKETGQGIIDYIQQERVNYAKTLLRNTALNNSQIAERAGYSDAKYFAKLFKKLTGTSMSSYRRLYSG